MGAVAPSRREALILGAAGLAAAAAGFLAGPALIRLGGNPEADALGAAGFPDFEGTPRRLAEWRGRVLVCNFWATWCGPCREEIPLLIAVRQNYATLGGEVVGIAIDNAAKVREFSASFGISYPILLAEADGLDLMRKLGNSSGGLPYTVIADRQGVPVQRKLGALKPGELEKILDPLLKS
jgi:thiol-disulfide isomerase/thioredoxin